MLPRPLRRPPSVRTACLTLALLVWGPVGRGQDDPSQIAWQRTLDDALAVVEASGRPLLICVNADGEVASDGLARGRYRDPGFVARTRGFVPLIASPFRHAETDHTPEGRRVPCPRFGRVTCGEHIAVEPLVFARWFDGTRVAPRHVGVGVDGDALFDLYLLNDLSVVDRTLDRHGVQRSTEPSRSGMTALLDDPDATTRSLLEEVFLAADTSQRSELASRSVEADRATRHPELLRMALHDLSPEVRAAAGAVVAAEPGRLPLDVLIDGLRLVRDPGRVEACAVALLVGAGEGSGAVERRARRVGRVHRALDRPSAVIDVERWRGELGDAPPARPRAGRDADALYAAIAVADEALTAAPDDQTLRLELARALLDASEHMLASDPKNVGFLLADAQDAAEQVARARPDDGLAWATVAWAAFLQNQNGPATAAAEKALPLLVGQAASRPAMDALESLLHGRTKALYDLLDMDDDVPEAWVADVVAAVQVMLVHPDGDGFRLASALDALAGLELAGLHVEATAQALRRHPSDPDLHDHWRWHLQRDLGPLALLTAYDDDDFGMSASRRDWYSGYARLLGGDLLRAEGRVAESLTAYESSEAAFRASVGTRGPDEQTAGFIGLALAGAARVHLDAGRLGDARRGLEQALAVSARCFALPDGNGVTPASTAGELLTALRRRNQMAEAAALERGLIEAGVVLGD